MSLKVWLPLNGDLENKGTGSITAISGTPSYKTGKIGTNALDLKTRITFDCPDLANLQTFSICFWGMSEASTTLTANWTDLMGFTDVSASGSNGTFRWETGYNGNNGIHWHDNATNAMVNGAHNHITQHGFWKHCCVVFDYAAGKLYSYDDGVLTQTHTHAGGHFNSTGRFYLGETNKIEGRITDVRIYDHALSAAEVREISQGLVLHYKLDGFFGGAGENLVINGDARNGLTGWANWGTASSRQVITVNNKKWFTFKTDANGNYGGFSQDRGIALYKPNTQYTISALMYASANASGRLWVHTRSTEGGANLAQYSTTVNVTTFPALYTFTFNTGTNASYTINKLNLMIGAVNTSSTLDFYISDIKVEEGTKATSWVPCKEEGGYNTTKIQDSSGYNHNGTINGNILISSDTNRYSYSTQFDGVDDSITVPYNTICPENIFTINLWFKKDALGSKNYETLFGGPSGFEMDTRAGSASTLSLYMASARSGNRNAITTLSFGNWYMVTMTRDGVKEKYYINGIYQSEIDAKPMPIGDYYIGAWQTTAKQNYQGLISDFRIYCTVLDAEAIRQLYEVRMKIDNQGNAHSFELVELGSNILAQVELSRINLQFANGLNKYTQTNCQVTLTEDGYHIYRPPNLTTANNGNTMWGGLLINNQTTRTIAPYNASRDNIWNLQKNHIYMFAFHAKGQSSNSPSLVVESNMGWDRIAGVGPNPTYLARNTIPANFNGEQDCYIIFKIEDDIIKVATENKSSYVQGNSYLSYRELCLNYGYTATGALGTDLYLTGFRLYDITNYMAEFTKMGQMKFFNFIEQTNQCKIRKGSELISTEFIEF